jgi:hypothetical protein
MHLPPCKIYRHYLKFSRHDSTENKRRTDLAILTRWPFISSNKTFWYRGSPLLFWWGSIWISTRTPTTLTEIFLWLSSAALLKFRGDTSVRQGPLQSWFFPIHHSLTIISLDGVYSSSAIIVNIYVCKRTHGHTIKILIYIYITLILMAVRLVKESFVWI